MAKKGLFSKLIIGQEKSEEFARSNLPSNRMELFWDTLKGSFVKLLLTNLIMLVLLIPMIMIIILTMGSYSTYGQLSNFNQGVGIGYPAIPNLIGAKEQVVLTSDVLTLRFLPFTMLISGLAFAGGGYIIRNLVWGEGVFVANDFIKGIKKNYFVCTLTLILYSILLVLFIIAKDYCEIFMAVMPNLAWLFVIAEVVTFIFMAFATVMALYMILMGVTYELKFFALVKNAFLFTIGLFPLNLIMLIVSAIPYVFFFMGSFLTSIGILIVLLIGISFTLLVWTVYGHWVFDRYINVQLAEEHRNRGIYTKQKRVNEEEIEKYKAQKKVVSDLTSRPIKPIDDDIVVENLPTHFRREDLVKLSEQKEAMRADNDKYISDHYNDERYVSARAELEKTQLDAETEELLEITRLELEGKKVPKKKKKGKKK